MSSPASESAVPSKEAPQGDLSGVIEPAGPEEAATPFPQPEKESSSSAEVGERPAGPCLATQWGVP